MHKQREDLDLIFRRTTPEIVLANIMSKSFNAEKASLDLSFNAYTYKVYDHFAVSSFPEYSPNETQLRHAEIQNIIDADKENGIFSLLYKYAGNILMIENNEPVCKMEEVLNWNSISSRLGQDIFVTAWLAKMDIQKRGLARIDINFCWAPIIKTDDRRLNAMVEQKLAENHFHHHGSTQSFSLSWACLMNHPNYISRFFKYRKQFRENLNFNLSRGVTDNVLEWKERIAYAALIRAMLFERCLNLITAEEVREKFKIFHTLPVAYSIKELTEPLRLIYGAKFEQPQKTTKCLDYAICPQICFVDEDDHERILAGERAFLYHCFAMQFSGKFTVFEASLFYFYILLKSNFRSELIQVNKRVGFDNFSEYQNRKNQFFENVVEYWVEAQRIGVCGNIKENNLASLETRIMPKNSSSLMQKEIARLDKLVKFADKSEDFFNVQFYVIHFGKKPFMKEEFEKKEYFLVSRNYHVRKTIEIQAKALANVMTKYPKTAHRIRGIDACSSEIGCRPETFATEFRFLRGWLREKAEIRAQAVNECRTKMGATFHVGEDFLDIVDGLRAIDEAIRFLELQKGDRLGHALALGINPKDFYNAKRNNVYLAKQDYLDNLVWILYRSLELNIAIESNYRAMMTEKARSLLQDVYGKTMDIVSFGDMLDLYYQSWKLRGDYPEAYRECKYDKMYVWGRYDEYAKYMIRQEEDKYRNNATIAYFYYAYHFEREVKLAGLVPEAIAVPEWYIDLVKKFQQVLRMEIFKKGIAIECNPTSNVLIGTFSSYDEHPILTFNSHCLKTEVNEPDLCVSINTDDLGVFDTSLVNEYALMFRAIQMKRHNEGNFDDNAIYEYLDFIRQNGMNMVFQL